MQGSSRAAFASGHDAFAEVMRAGANRTALGNDLFGVTSALDSSAALRRALADPSRDARGKEQLLARIFTGKVSDGAVRVVSRLVAGRWHSDRDLSDAVESLAVQAVVVAAEDAGRLDALEDDLFRLERVVDGNHALRDAITDPARSGQDKAALVDALLSGKVGPEVLLLVHQALVAPRGRRFDRTLEFFGAVAARRREQLTAVVSTAVPLDARQRDRLLAALSDLYDRDVQLNVFVDPEVLGGIRVQIGNEVVDGTILHRLEDARRRLAG